MRVLKADANGEVEGESLYLTPHFIKTEIQILPVNKKMSFKRIASKW